MTNRIGGDFNAETIEAFRAAYSSQLNTPEDQDIDQHTGLPTGTVSNTSPWIEHTGLWKYPSGKGPDQNLQRPFNPDSYIVEESNEDEENSEDQLTEKEIDNLIDEILEGEIPDQEIDEEEG